MNDGALRSEMVRVCRTMLAQGLTRGTSGNISVRTQSGMLITPTAVSFGDVQADMLLELPLYAASDDSSAAAVSAPARSGGGRPSSEWRIHAAILRARPEIGAVIHAHPPFGTAVACMRRNIPAFHYMVAVAGGDDIRCADYALFGTAELAANAVAALEGRTACLLANHGTITLGRSLADALMLSVEAETLAQQYCHALAAGEPVLLSADEMRRVRDAFGSYRSASS